MTQKIISDYSVCIEKNVYFPVLISMYIPTECGCLFMKILYVF